MNQEVNTLTGRIEPQLHRSDLATAANASKESVMDPVPISASRTAENNLANRDDGLELADAPFATPSDHALSEKLKDHENLTGKYQDPSENEGHVEKSNPVETEETPAVKAALDLVLENTRGIRAVPNNQNGSSNENITPPAADDSLAADVPNQSESSDNSGIPVNTAIPESPRESISAILARNQPGEAAVLVTESAPLSSVAKRLCLIAENTLPADVAALVISHIQQSVHLAVSNDPELLKHEDTESGLSARITALEILDNNLKKYVDPLLEQLSQNGLVAAGAMQGDLTEEIARAKLVLTTKTTQLAPATTGSRIFNAVRDMLTPSPNDEVGQPRAHRNRELKTALAEMDEIARELKKNAGNADWETTSGKASLEQLSVQQNRIKKLTSGVESQIDGNVMSERMKESNKLLQEAAANSSDSNHKSALEAAQKQLQAMIEAISKFLSKVFTRSPDSPKP